MAEAAATESTLRHLTLLFHEQVLAPQDATK
jgi:hypothetical protein